MVQARVTQALARDALKEFCNMKFKSILIPACALAMVTAPVFAEEPPPAPSPAPEETSIPFVNHGGVDDWRADGSQTLYFRDVHGKWYKGVLFSPAYDLPYADTIGIETNGIDRLDKFSTIIVRDRRYPLMSLIAVDAPPKKQVKSEGK